MAKCEVCNSCVRKTVHLPTGRKYYVCTVCLSVYEVKKGIRFSKIEDQFIISQVRGRISTNIIE